ncbi:MAG: thiamine diphosphokinase, partial [Acidimicrobiia bacterium]
MGKTILSFAGGDVQPVIAIFAGGDAPPRSVLEQVPPDAFVIGADSGLDHARALGRGVDLLVGDLDSVSAEGLSVATDVRRYPADKDETDLALALEAAAQMSPIRVIVVGGAGGRIDHLLANAALLCRSEYRDFQITWLPGRATIYVVHGRLDLEGSPGDLVSLLPYGGPATGISTDGLRWPLAAATLEPGATVGVSNEMREVTATVSVTDGTLLVIHIP